MIMDVKILLADAHPILLLGLRQTITQQPHLSVVGEASTGDLALALALELRPDVVVMEVCLPGMNGIEAIRRILCALPATKIVIFSGEASHTLVDKALQARASGYLSKGGRTDELIRAIESVMEGKVYLSPEINLDILEHYQKSCLEDPLRPKPPLSERERRLLRLIAEGRRSREIAGDMAICARSVDACRSRLMKKLSCASLAALVRYSVRERIVDP
jgi:two-component system NarL family response regulator